MIRQPRKLKIENEALTEAGRLSPLSLDLTLNMIPLHRASAVLTERDLPLRIHDLVEVYNQNGSCGIFRVASISETKMRDRRVDLTHGLDVLSDSHFTTAFKFTGTVAEFLQTVLEAQAQKIGSTPFWTLGTVEDTNPWTKEISYDNLMECLTEVARAEEDYMFTFDMSGFPWVLNFVARDQTVLSEFRLRHNTENCQITLDDGDLCTRLILSVGTEGTSAVSPGYYTYDDLPAQQTYGVVVRTAGVEKGDVPTAQALQAWVAAYFDRHHAPTVQISIDGEELSRHTGCPIDGVHLGRMCRVALPDYGQTFSERIVSVQYPDVLNQPRRVKVSLANKRETAESAFAEIRNTAARAGGTAKKAKEKADTVGDETGAGIPEFKPTLNYAVGDKVTHEGKTWEFIAKHPAGAWNAAQVRELQTLTTRTKIAEIKIDENSAAIALKVGQGEVATRLVMEVGNVSIENGNLIVDGMITADGLATLDVTTASLTTDAINVGDECSIDNEGYIDCAGLTVAGMPFDDVMGSFVSVTKSESNGLVTLTFGRADGSNAGEVSFNRAVAPTISGSWDGSGTYTITSSITPTSGSKLTVTPSVRLNGNGGSTFTGELLSDGSSPTVQDSASGYLVANGRTVTVYTKYEGGSYSGAIASTSVAAGTVTITADDQGNPDTDVNGKPVKASCSTCGSAQEGIYLTNGSWNSSGKMALNARLGSSSGPLISRIWVQSNRPTSSNVTSLGTNRGNRDSAGSISKSGLQANTYLGFTVSCNNRTHDYYIAVNA